MIVAVFSLPCTIDIDNFQKGKVKKVYIKHIITYTCSFIDVN